MGGEIKFERERDYVESADGRIIPFSLLSSGQQELLPLWLTLDYLTSWRRDPGETRLFYIEEPEAHLFPSAQNLLTEYLATVVSAKNSGTYMFITTHSPYLLSKLNNLLKAGLLSKKLGKTAHDKIAAVTKKDAWLEPNSLSAYAIVDGVLKNLIDDDGLIDATYLDAASGDISSEFLSLLEIEDSYDN